MSKLCVKKPYTVLVGVILVLVLGVVAFTRMTTDLLPNMDLPYMIVYTTDPGASPESVEKSVSKPLESALGTTTGLKEIQSTSSENVSMLIMEFEQGTDMNAVSIEMSNTIDQVKGSLPEACASPVMMQITPDMMPVMAASVDIDGKETKEISDYVNDTLLNRFERIDGVASVSSSGMISSKVKVTLDQKKIDALNDKVLASVNSELADAKKQLDDGQNQLNEAKKQISSGENTLSEQTDSMSAQLGEASAAVDTANAQLNAILSEETTLTANQAAFQMEQEQLQQFADMNSQVSLLAKMIVIYDITGTVQDITKDDINIDSMKESFAQLTQALKDPAAYITGMSEENYAAAIAALTAALPDQDMSQLTGVSKSDFSTLVTTTAYAATRVEEISAELNNINTRLMTISAMKPELEAGLKQAQEAYAQVEAGKMQAAVAAAQGSAQLAVGKASLENAQTQLDDAKKQFEDARDEAYKKADISGIVTADMISNILIAENFEMPAGYIKDSSDNSYILKVGKAFSTLDELKNVLLFSMDVGDIGDIYLTDVASVEYASESEDDSHTIVNGNSAILLTFSKQSTASTSAVSDAINEEIEKIQAEDDSIHITPLMDQGDYIHMVVENVLSNLIFGGILAVIVLLFFLRDIRPTVVIAFSIPLSVLFAIVLMYFTNLTLNLISLSGLALGVGMLVDNSIVVIENIYRLRGQGMSAPKAAVQGAQQMGGAVFASTLTTVCVFLPIVFAQGISKQLFTDMGLTIAYSLSASLIVALTVVPAMSSMILKGNKQIKSHSRFSGIGTAYEKTLRWCLSHRLISLGTVIALFLFACVSVTRMGMVFIPNMSSNQMSASLEMPDEATDTEIEALTDKAAAMIQDVDGVQTVGAMTGSGGMSMLSGGGGNSATFYIILEDGADNAAVAKEIRDKSDSLEGEMTVSESNMDMSSITGSGVSINVYGENLDDLQKVCADLAKELENIDGLIDISDGNEDPDMQKVITVNKEAAMREGLTVAQVYASLAADLQNEVTSTTLTVGTEELPVVVVKPTEVTAENVMKQKVTSTDAASGEEKEVSLNTIASQKDSEAPTTIKRAKNERTMTVSAGVDEDHNASLLSGQVQEMLDNYNLPDGITVETAGENETIMDAMKDLILMLVLAVIFIYLIMVAQFQSLLSPFIVMFTMPLAFTGGLLALLVTGQDMSILAMLGFIILAGVVVNNGIVFVSCVNELRLDGMEKRDALVEAGKMRMRPIFMTAMTTILSMSTMALGIGTGGEMGQAMAIVVIGGLTYATVLTLFVVPIMYDIFNRKKKLQKIDIGEEDIV